MKTAIVGLPMVGKTSLFTILTGVHESTRVGSMEARVGMTKVPDARLDALAKIFDPPKITQATVEYLDFPSISKEALRDPSALASLRVVDALAHVLRTFDSDTVPHEKGSVDPIRDFEDVEVELILSDLVVVEKRMERLDKDRKKTKAPDLDKEFALLERIKTELDAESGAARMEFSEDENASGVFSFYRSSRCCAC
jgi:ribosome-binding ATPase YchF (GTP1/OBG family)